MGGGDSPISLFPVPHTNPAIENNRVVEDFLVWYRLVCRSKSRAETTHKAIPVGTTPRHRAIRLTIR